MKNLILKFFKVSFFAATFLLLLSLFNYPIGITKDYLFFYAFTSGIYFYYSDFVDIKGKKNLLRSKKLKKTSFLSLINFKRSRHHPFTSFLKNNIPIICFISSILITGFLFLILFVAMRFGRPFSYEDNVPESKYVLLETGRDYSSYFQASHDYLGAVKITLRQYPNISHDSDEFFLKENPNNVKKLNIFVELYEKEGTLIYKNTHSVLFTLDNEFSYDIGFPTIFDSKDKNYYIKLNFEANQEDFDFTLRGSLTDGENIKLTPKYTMSLSQVVNDPVGGLKILSNKINLLDFQSLSFFKSSLLFFCLLLVIFWIFTKRLDDLFKITLVYSTILLALAQMNNYYHLFGPPSISSITALYFTGVLAFSIIIFQHRRKFSLQLLFNTWDKNFRTNKTFNKLETNNLTYFPIVSLIVLLIFIGSLLRLANLSQLSLNQDEVYYTIAAKNYDLFGVSQISWNGVADENISGSFIYNRAKPLIVLLSLVWQKIGYSEFALRLPFAIVGSIFLVFVYSFTKNIISRTIALYTLVFTVFDSHLIYYSRTVREYIILAFLSLLIYFVIDKFVEKYPRSKFYIVPVITLLLLLFAIISFQVMLIVAALIVFFLYLLFYFLVTGQIKYREIINKNLLTLITLPIVFLSVFIYFRDVLTDVFTNNIARKIFLALPNLDYLKILVDAYKFSYLFWPFFVSSLIYFLMRPKKSLPLFLVIIPLLILIFIFDYSIAIRYTLFLRVFVHIIISLGIVIFIHLLVSSKQRHLSQFLSFFIVIGMTNISFFKTPEIPLLLEKTQTEWNHSNSLQIDISTLAPNMKAAFDYIKLNHQPSDIIITRDYSVYYYLSPLFTKVDFKVYFVNKNENILLDLQTNKEMDLNFVLSSTSRKWVVVGRTTYFPFELLKYMHENMELISPNINGIFRINYLNKETIYWPQVFVDKKN